MRVSLIVALSFVGVFSLLVLVPVIQESYQQTNPCSDDEVPMRAPSSDKIECIDATFEGTYRSDGYSRVKIPLVQEKVQEKAPEKVGACPNDKIEMVINFEVEPLLPFPAKDALIDFIITSINKEEKSAQVLVAVVQKRHLLEHLSLIEQAGCNPDIVTVDMFAFYGLYSQIPSYQLLSGSVALIDMSMNTTSIVIVQTNQLRIVRTLPYGMAFVANICRDL